MTKVAAYRKLTATAALLALVAFIATRADAQGDHAHHAAEPELHAAIVTEPMPPKAGTETKIIITLRDSEGKPPQGLEVGHERLAHFLLVSENLDEFHHLHAEDFGAAPSELVSTGVYPLRATLGLGGRWLVSADLLVRGAQALLTLPLAVDGPPQKATARNFEGARRAGGLDLTLHRSPERPRAGERVDFTLLVEEDGKPAARLARYLGAAAHVAAFPEGAATFAHLHGISGSAHGVVAGHAGHGAATTPGDLPVAPTIIFSHTFGAAGDYRLWTQLRNGGEIVTVPFDVRIGE